MEPHRASPLCLHLPELARQAARQPPRHHPADRRHYHQDRPYRHLRHRPKPLSKVSKSAMPKWLPSTFSAMLSEATGTTPSLQDNKSRRDAIIPHQLLSEWVSCGWPLATDRLGRTPEKGEEIPAK